MKRMVAAGFEPTLIVDPAILTFSGPLGIEPELPPSHLLCLGFPVNDLEATQA